MSEVSLQEVEALLATAPSSAVLLETFLELEGQVSLSFSESHLNSDADFLRTFYSAFLIVLLLEDEVNEARMLTHRMPGSLVRVDPVLQNAVLLLQAVWHKDHAKVYWTIRQMKWPENISGLVRSYETHFQNKAFTDLTVAYQAIRPTTLSSYLGLDEMIDQSAMATTNGASPQLINALTARGWEWNAEKKLFIPKDSTSISKSSGPGNFKIGQLVSSIGAHGD